LQTPNIIYSDHSALSTALSTFIIIVIVVFVCRECVALRDPYCSWVAGGCVHSSLGWVCYRVHSRTRFSS